MEQLLQVTQKALLNNVETGRGQPVDDSLRLLGQHRLALLDAYPTALMEHFAQPQATQELDLEQFSLFGADQIQAQVELSKVRQSVMQTTGAALAELDRLVSAAQGLPGVQPGRNPLRPDNYLHALQQVLDDTGVNATVRQIWMQPMHGALGHLLLEEYRDAARMLRAQTVQPEGGAMSGATSDMLSDMFPDIGAATQAEDVPLTAERLRQMLADAAAQPPAGTLPAMAWQPGWADLHSGAASVQWSPPDGGSPADAATELMEDMALLEQVLAQLSGAAGTGQPGAPPVSGADVVGHAMAPDTVSHMLEQITRSAHLLPPVHQAVKNLETALEQLVQHDAGFLTDSAHPARRLLDALTQRSLAFTDETAPGFSQFMHLVTRAVTHLSAIQIEDAGPFDTVLQALETAWAAQELKIKTRQETGQQARNHETLAGQIAADIRKLPEIGQLPADILAFATGPWAKVLALAQMTQDGADADPQGYRALTPVLLWSAQPDLTRQDPTRLNAVIPGLLAKLRKGLKSINYPTAQTSALLQRLVDLHQSAFERSAADAHNADAATTAPVVDDPDTPDTPDPYADFMIGAWVELHTHDRVVRTQLTWASPQGTLFLFTAPDASTQSMTLRMRNKLVAEGLLRVVPADPAAQAGA